MKAPFSLKGAVLQWFMNALFVQTSEIYYSESLRAFFHSMSLTSVLHPWCFLYKHCSWFILRVNDLQCTKYNEIAVSSEGGLKITGIALTSGKEQKCLCKSVLGAHLGTPLMFFVFRCSQWLAAGGQPKHRWAGFISESTWIVTGPDPVLLLQSVWRGLSSIAHSPARAMRQPTTPLHKVWRIFPEKSLLPTVGGEVCLAHGRAEHCQPLLVMKRRWKITVLLDLTWTERAVSLGFWH